MASVQNLYKQIPPEKSYLSKDDEAYFRRVFEEQAARSYLYLSLGIGLIALLLPGLLVWRGGYSIHDSISSFYTSDVRSSRDVMVGLLCAVGVFLFLFHGLSKWENRLLNVAGGAIIFVAWIPMYVSELMHRGLAVLFFLMIGIVAIFFSKGRIKDVPHQRARRVFASLYTGAGIAMIGLPLSIAVLQFTPWRFDHYMFWIEFFAIMSFAIYWFVKTAEYRMLLGIRWFAP